MTAGGCRTAYGGWHTAEGARQTRTADGIRRLAGNRRRKADGRGHTAECGGRDYISEGARDPVQTRPDSSLLLLPTICPPASLLSAACRLSFPALTAADAFVGGKNNGKTRDALNKSDFCDKRLKYKGFYRKINLKSEFPKRTGTYRRSGTEPSLLYAGRARGMCGDVTWRGSGGGRRWGRRRYVF